MLALLVYFIPYVRSSYQRSFLTLRSEFSENKISSQLFPYIQI